ncbi:hypothetical protein RRG08_002321 [Elysia crispata]|uniref:Uncharacterized protein n=1 Tax=Elysia crispata TaxID=231223 RepID=A0AAE0ZBZ0_9GAST|nr:hypothetical protein RRG08_002321 [Elysia crispata]
MAHPRKSRAHEKNSVLRILRTRSNPTRETILVSWSSCYAGIPFAVRSGAVMTLQSPETGLSRQMTSWDKLAKADRLGRATYYTEETESCV